MAIIQESGDIQPLPYDRASVRESDHDDLPRRRMQTLRYIAHLLTTRMKFSEAKEIVDLIDPLFADEKERAFAEIAHQEAEAGNYEDAGQTLRFVTGLAVRTDALRLLAEAFAAQGRIDEARVVWEEAWNLGLRIPGDMSRISALCALAATGGFEGAQQAIYPIAIDRTAKRRLARVLLPAASIRA